jgi:hypothetical protein
MAIGHGAAWLACKYALASLQGRIWAWYHVWLRAGLYVLADARLAGLPESEADMHHRFRCGGEHMRTDGNHDSRGGCGIAPPGPQPKKEP